jgi:cell division protein FtsW (lipid II flippase)
MAWSWLGLLLGFALPLLIYIASYFVNRRLDHPYKKSLPALLAGFAAFCSTLALLLLIFSSPYWKEGSRIVWTGMQANSEPLIIGGKHEETAISWPNKATFPRLKITPQPDTPAAVEISGGGAFIFDEQQHRFLNGKAIPVGQTMTVGDYQIRVNHLGRSLKIWRWFSSEVEILDAGGQTLAGFTLRPNRTRALGYLLSGNFAEPLTRLENIAVREKLEEWAGGVWLIRNDNERLYVLTKDDSLTSECPLPTALTVKWVNLTLPVKISANEKTTTLDFESPWRLSSPLPVQKIEGCPEQKKDKATNLNLVVTARPNPCETALVLGFGQLAGNVRQTVTLDEATNKFNSPAAVDNELPSNCPPGVKCENRRVGTSQVSVQGSGPYTFYLTTVRDLPSRKGILALIFLAFAIFIAGLALVYPRLPDTNRFVLYGIITTIWLFLSFRLLLAFRYVLDPAALDNLSINGIKRAFFGLMIMPGLLMLWARLRCDRSERPVDTESRRRAKNLALYYLLGLLVCGLCGLYFPSRLWSGLPPAYHTSFGDVFSGIGLAFIIVAWLVAFLLALHIKFLYEPDPKGILVKVFVEPWYFAEKYAARAKDFWANQLSWTLRQRGRLFLIGVLLAIPCWAFYVIATGILPGDKTTQELVVPLIFYAIAILWIGLKLYLKSEKGRQLTSRQTLWLIVYAVILISLPAIAVPLAIFDFGSILPVLAILLSLIAVLLAGRSFLTGVIFLASGVALFLAGLLLPSSVTLVLLIVGLFIGVLKSKRSARAGLAVAFGVALLFGLGILFYQNLEGMILPNAKYIPFVGGQGRVFARLLNYKKGSLAQQYAVQAKSAVGSEGLPYQELLNGNQHTWENKAIAHEGGWFGQGFGEAPIYRSQVRRDTLQYDSVFSFFVMSEYGLIGGLLLLLMYACPLFIIFLGGRDRLDTGYALALIVAGSFLIESLYHAGMNLGAFPMTGRNLPLLSVNSPSDLLRWILLWGFALQAIFWRYEGRGHLKEMATSLTSEDEVEGQQAEQEPVNPASTTPRPRTYEPVWAYSIAIWFIPVITALTVLINGWGVLREDKEFEKFNYETVLDTVRWYLDDGVITFDEQKKTLNLHENRLNDPDEQDFIQQEVERFNKRPDSEKLEEIREKREALFEADLAKVNSVRDYQGVFREISKWHDDEPMRGIFRLVPIRDENGRIVTYKVTANPNFNVSYSFKVGHTANDLPKVTYGNGLLLGPAWVAGRYETAINPDALIPWADYLKNALEVEWIRLKPEDSTKAARLYGQLTLNKSLHDAAMNFIAAKGMKLHEDHLKRKQGSNDYQDKLPPRVALSVITLPKGETLALGGWPRMTSLQNSWEQARAEVDGTQREYWVPSARWIEREAPQSIEARYRGDRNFDRNIVMGSSTKPLWAAAVLKVHPNIAEKLQVAVASTEENEVFGLQLEGKPWDLNGHGDDWVGFRTYLRQSDNRYHIRLGFLGLAEKEGKSIKAAGRSSSRNESLTGDKRPWEKYPQFLPSVKISAEKNMLSLGADPHQPNMALANSELATALRGMFSIGVKSVSTPTGQKREFSFRRSFWTGNENDDLNVPASKVTSLFNQIAPEAPDFAFDKLYKPRDYVTMLLGSGTNLWANVDFAAAFGSCLTGKPVIAHIVRSDAPLQTLEGRKMLSPELAFQLHNGLRDVAEEPGGTAYKYLSQSKSLEKLKRYSFYAKTGTLKVEEDELATSRIVLAIVKWKNEKKGEVASGLVFSIVAEQGGSGTAANWLNSFLVANVELIANILDEEAASQK